MKKYIILGIFLATLTSLGVASAYDQPMSNTGTPQTGMYTPGGRTPQAGSSDVGGNAPSGAVNNNKGAGDYYYDEKTYQWKRKTQ